ncbi:U-BOX DOMAIN-CONTAINING PROTEIN 1 [Salix purpurea]|uniref:RING-type E3 ubiquitin transferase n=1 Tax=Salix purpurea TaxID=77065 RepID=A0A9Q0Z1P7_SALPP|nr:U-BOX DOMAIN-CONTAINING PROTEIN 1 [Salix purpurea]
MNVALPPIMISSGFLPTGSLVESLTHLSNEVASVEKLPFVQFRNISTMIRRIKLLSSLFEDIREINSPLPPSSILCLTELFSVIQRVKLLIQGCKDGSSLWGLTQTEFLSNQFHVLVKEMGGALDILPLSLLNLSTDTREQVQLLHRQAKRVDLLVDPRELQKREELLQIMTSNNQMNSRDKGSVDFVKVREVLSCIGLRSQLDYEEEISKLEAEAEKQAGTGGLFVVSIINNLISLVTYSKSVIFIDRDKEEIKKNFKQRSANRNQDVSSSSRSVLSNIPDEFRCPISLDLMKDPVIVSSGHTYDRNSIAEWINSGHQTCPKSGQRLIHMALIPNYALKSLVHQWCQDNNVPLIDDSSSSKFDRSSSMSKLSEKGIDHKSATKAAMDTVKMTAEFLVGKLAMGSPEVQRQAAYELRLLAKTGMGNRRIIAEAGAIPFLVTLLSSTDPKIQENAVTAMLNLSILENNKTLIMSAGSIDSIINVLESGKTMEARENAAATIYSLSIINDCTVTIGTRPRAFSALVGLLREGTSTGKKDAASALFNLSVNKANKESVVVAGAVPLLVEMLMDDKAGITDDALALLALLLGCSDGLEEIRKSRVLVPLLIDLLRFGSTKGKENSITLLLGLCKDGGEEVARRLLVNPRSVPSLQSLSANGSLKSPKKS